MNVKQWVLQELKTAVLLYNNNGDCEEVHSLHCNHCPFRRTLCTSPSQIQNAIKKIIEKNPAKFLEYLI